MCDSRIPELVVRISKLESSSSIRIFIKDFSFQIDDKVLYLINEFSCIWDVLREYTSSSYHCHWFKLGCQ